MKWKRRMIWTCLMKWTTVMRILLGTNNRKWIRSNLALSSLFRSLPNSLTVKRRVELMSIKMYLLSWRKSQSQAGNKIWIIILVLMKCSNRRTNNKFWICQNLNFSAKTLKNWIFASNHQKIGFLRCLLRFVTGRHCSYVTLYAT